MKKFPVPNKKLVTDEDVADHITELIFNSLNWLSLDGYAFYVVTPGQPSHSEYKEAGMSIDVEFPYKKFKVSIQEDTVKKCKTEPLSNRGFWENIENGALHECLHVLVWRLAELANRRFTTQQDIRDADEELTDHLTHVIHKLMRDARIVKK